MTQPMKLALAGEGGQGVQAIAEILAEAANAAGKQALYIPNFGVEQRGGVSVAYVQIGDRQIGSPKFVTADILVALSPRAVQRTIGHAGADTIYIYDNSLIQEAEVSDQIIGLQYFDVTPPCPLAAEPNQDLPPDMIAGEPKTCSFTTGKRRVRQEELPAVKQVISIPANDIAKKEFTPRVFNVLILGAVVGATGLMPLDGIKRALESKLGDKFKAKPELRDMNFRALERGYRLATEAV